MNKTLVSVLRLIVLVGVFVMLPLINNKSQAQTPQCASIVMDTIDCPSCGACTNTGAAVKDEVDYYLPGTGQQSIANASWSCGAVNPHSSCNVACSGPYVQAFVATCCVPNGKGCNVNGDCCSGICNSNGACAASGGGSGGGGCAVPVRGSLSAANSVPNVDCVGPDCDPGTGCGSPILIDTSGQGFFLTNVANGVKFDISGTGTPVQMAWTANGASNAFLALPGSDGLVHNGKELFGNFTAQPPSSNPNGFLALAVYDLPANGGNGDGIIDSRDAIYSSLRLWLDANHDGISQPNELHTLSSLGVASISLKYHFSRKEDQFGNLFRFRSRLNVDDPDDQSEVGPTTYDVFFVTATNSN
jgi:hypothetical protein